MKKNLPRTTQSSIIERPVLISGVQPSGQLHIGNYLAALKNFVDLQNSGKYRCYFFVADYHSLTEAELIKDIKSNTYEVALDYLAVGINPKKSIIFIQSQVPQCTELAWIFNTLTPLGELYRMTQFKEKSERMISVNAGLLTYPTLMAADILLYDAQFVPVGEDQLQHLELTREIARKFNNKFGKIFIEPQPILTVTPRIMSLDDPTKKMSKSRPTGCIFLNDEPKIIEQKIKSAVTDSGKEIKYDPENKPAIANLLHIYSGFSGKTIPAIEKQFRGKGYFEFKKSLAQIIIDYFEPFQKKKAALSKKTAAVEKILRTGAVQAKKIANKKLKEIKEKIGLYL